VHPSNVVAYTQTAHPPLPYRFRSTTLKLQIPSLASYLPDTRFFREMRKTATWKFLSSTAFTLRTWARRSIWGDRLFLQFQGPTTLLLQSRGSHISDSLTSRDINEIADAPAGSVHEAVTLDLSKENAAASSGSRSVAPAVKAAEEKPTTVTFATVGSGGTVKFKS